MWPACAYTDGDESAGENVDFGMEEKMANKKIITVSLIGIAVLAGILVLCFPMMKLRVLSHHYERYGSYILFPQEKRVADLRPVRLATQSAEYRQKGLKITNVLYYPELQRLSFGFIYDRKEYEKYDIKVTDPFGQDVAGVLLISGRERFYTTYLQKLNFRLEEPLRQQVTYTIRIVDEKGERLGALNFQPAALPS